MIQVQTCRRLAGAVGSWDAILRSHALRNGERIGVKQLTLLVFFPLTSPLAAPLDLITFFNSEAGKRGGFMARNKSGPHLKISSWFSNFVTCFSFVIMSAHQTIPRVFQIRRLVMKMESVWWESHHLTWNEFLVAGCFLVFLIYWFC